MTNETAPKRIWATYNDAFGINWQDGQFTTSEQPACGRYTPYIRADISEIRTERVRSELEAAQARIAELEEGLTLIERIYYMEGKPAAWRAAHMNGTAREAHNRESYSCKRLFPRAALEGKGYPANQDSHGTDQQHEIPEG